jgi:hypothetical protein
MVDLELVLRKEFVGRFVVEVLEQLVAERTNGMSAKETSEMENYHDLIDQWAYFGQGHHLEQGETKVARVLIC